MTTKQILEYQLLSFENFHISVWNIIFIIGLLVIIRFVLWSIKKMIRRRLIAQNRMDEGKFTSIFQLSQYFIYVITIIIIIESLGIGVTWLLGASAALLVGIGMGLQQTFNDILSGIIILFEGTLEVKDIVEVDGIVGEVKEIRLRTCEIETRRAIVMIIPNSKFVNSNVINWSHNNKITAFYVTVGVAYGTDTKLVKNTLINCANKNPDVLQNPAPMVRFDNFGDSALEFKLFFWTDKIWEVEMIKSDLRFMIDEEFKINHIKIPFPQRDVHIYKKDIQ